jgi:L-ascorbate metabolism protein UlaG (beta-lactamase superfamily)
MIFPRWHPRPELRPRGTSANGAALTIRWLGTAGHVVETQKTTILIDPYFTRRRLLQVGLLPLRPDTREIDARLSSLGRPQDGIASDAGAPASSAQTRPARVDAILCGHSHFDHLLDAPYIARKTGAKIIGSRSTCAFARGSGVHDRQIVMVPPAGAELTVGDVHVRFVPSRHGRIGPFGVPFKGEVSKMPRLPARFYHYKMGGAFGILLRAPGASVYHNGSADLIDAELDRERANVLLVGLAGRKNTRNYLARLTSALSPGLILPTHHDSFFGPFDAGVRLLPGVDLDGFAAEVKDRAPDATLITPDYFEEVAIPPGDARGAVIVS